jgi:hypothetical protein
MMRELIGDRFNTSHMKQSDSLDGDFDGVRRFRRERFQRVYYG